MSLHPTDDTQMPYTSFSSKRIGDTPKQLGSGLVADGVMIDGVFISKEQVRELLKIDKISLFKGQCIACGGNHGGLACPKMAINCKAEG